MKRCLKVIIKGEFSHNNLIAHIKEIALSLHIEGTIQLEDVYSIKTIVSGSNENIEQFIEMLHKIAHEQKIDSIEIEPFLQVKNHRGAFRIIE